MARGFLTGAIMGTVVAGLGALGAAVVIGPPTPPEGPGPVAERAVASGEPETGAAAPEAPAQDAEPTMDAPPSDTGAGAAPDETAATPDEGAPQEGQAAPIFAPQASDRMDNPPEPVAEGQAPDAPGVTEDSVTRSEAPALSAVLAESARPGPEPRNAEPPAVGDMPPGLGTATETGAPVDLVVEEEAPVQPSGRADAPDAPRREAEPDIATDPADPPQEQTPEVARAGQAGDAEAETPAAVPAPAGTETAEETADPERPVIGQPAGSILNRDPAVRQSRLPRIAPDSETAVAAEPEPEPETEETAGADRAVAQDSPLVRFAAPVQVPADLPRMAIILIDDGSGPLGPDSLGAFPFPVTFAIDPGHPDPQGAAQAYRALGFEVMALATVPDNAQPSDVEVALAGALAAVPEAVAVLEEPGAGLQVSRAVSTQAADYLAASGHGLVMQPKPLNTAQQLAARAGVPSAPLFRDFDSEGQDASVIRRFLDQAAFRARQEGAVVMLGRVRADTISALVLWGLQDRASSVALVPVSTVLRETQSP